MKFLKTIRPAVAALALLSFPVLGADDFSCVVKDEPSDAAERARSVLVIYNHGSDGTLRRFNCFARPPFWVEKLGGETIDGRPILFHFPCIRTQTDEVEGTLCERGVCKRAARIQDVVSNCLARGYKSSNIFLAGHSVGAWASLLVKRANPALVNGVIATAPAFDGKREERFCDTPDCLEPGARDRGLMRLQHDRWLAGGSSSSPELNALVLGF
jgi:pimeloyl-ACP methyl ester carboxylesterase